MIRIYIVQALLFISLSSNAQMMLIDTVKNYDEYEDLVNETLDILENIKMGDSRLVLKSMKRSSLRRGLLKENVKENISFFSDLLSEYNISKSSDLEFTICKLSSPELGNVPSFETKSLYFKYRIPDKKSGLYNKILFIFEESEQGYYLQIIEFFSVTNRVIIEPLPQLFPQKE